jgi:uncharacterized protein YybS (DUF2232 family)
MRFKDVMGCVSAALIMLLASAWVPILGPFIGLLTPLPFLYYTTKLGPQQGLKFVALTLLILGIIATLAGFPYIIFFGIELGLLGLVISEIYRRELTFGLTVFVGTGLMLCIGAVMLLLVGLPKGMSPMDLTLTYFQENISGAIEAYRETGLEPEKLQQLEEFGKLLTDILSKVYPALLVIGTGFVVWLNIVLSRPLFTLKALKYPDFEPMDRWRAPEFMVWGFIASGFALFLPTTGIKLLGINALLVMGVIYAFHGFSIVLFFLNKYRVPPWIRFVVYVMIVFQQLFLLILAMAGLFDQWFDFRKIYKRQTST